MHSNWSYILFIFSNTNSNIVESQLIFPASGKQFTSLFKISYHKFLPSRVPKDKEEIITIPDEPLVKKARIEDATDNISLSSESVQSIEVNDDSDLEQNPVPDVELIVEKIQEIEPQDEMDEPEVILDDIENENLKIVNEGADVMQIQEQTVIKDDDTNALTHTIKEIDSIEIMNINSFYEANTQMPSNRSNDTTDGEERPLSMEVVYDFPNTGKEKVPVLEKLEDENLPSTNETDDIQITCGQVVTNSQEIEGRSLDQKVVTSKVNGVTLPQEVLPNGDIPEGKKEIAGEVPKNNDLTVEDMLADFVDEVKEDSQVAQPWMVYVYDVLMLFFFILKC